MPRAMDRFSSGIGFVATMSPITGRTTTHPTID